MKPVVIFGAGTIAKLAWHYFKHEAQYDVASFVVDDSLLTKNTFCGLPVITDSQFLKQWHPESCKMFIALGYQNSNKLRKNIFNKYFRENYNATENFAKIYKSIKPLNDFLSAPFL